MSDHPNPTPVTEDSPDYSQHLLWRLTGARITSIGANELGEIYLSTDKGIEIVFGKDSEGEIAMFELQREGAEP